MNITATLDGDAVTIVDIDVNGSVTYVTYVDSADNLKRKFYHNGEKVFTIATGCTVN